MQRQAYVPGLTAVSAVLALGLTGCSSGSGTDVTTTDSKAGPAAPVAQPGRYRTLFEPCGSVSRAALQDLLPGAAELPDQERDKAYRGTASVTYDSDRRVGCSWKADTPDASHRLALDIERVVSYDPAVSDDVRAQEVFARKQAAANLPQAQRSPGAPVSPEGSGSPRTPRPPDGSATPPPGHTTAPQPPSGTVAPPQAPAPTTGLEPRTLDGLGEVAFLDDTLTTDASNGRRRTVSVVFRTSNVIVTVEYLAQTAGATDAPDSAELQEKARNLARLLVDRLEE
ncbi:DUF3558 domain-containing protein [Streptomyces sp. NBC_01216]|uniref:DUF3558 domain-containing protein n=1 Tax=unclassified Streptomyces TaxID=2593676 RepID=UPI002E121D97|nr:DUF3558 domain-containing protein [Streptomyces sp. NBC_01216]